MLEDLIKELAEARIEMLRFGGMNEGKKMMIERRLEDAYKALEKVGMDRITARLLSDDYVMKIHVRKQKEEEYKVDWEQREQGSKV